MDVEPDKSTFQYIARTIASEKLSLAKTEQILWNEVFPALESNLNSVAGNWTGWPDEWLIENLNVSSMEFARANGNSNSALEIKRCWKMVVEATQGTNA